jgi:hypothetical protein
LRTQATQGSRTTGIPRAMVLRLIRVLLGAPGFLATVACRFVASRLDSSVGESGPHDFAVRENAFVGAQARCTSSRPSLPASNVRDDRDTPLLVEAGWQEVITELRKTEAVYFSREGLTIF